MVVGTFYPNYSRQIMVRPKSEGRSRGCEVCKARKIKVRYLKAICVIPDLHRRNHSWSGHNEHVN